MYNQGNPSYNQPMYGGQGYDPNYQYQQNYPPQNYPPQNYPPQGYNQPQQNRYNNYGQQPGPTYNNGNNGKNSGDCCEVCLACCGAACCLCCLCDMINW